MSMPGLQKRKITARARTCRPMPVPGPLVPFSTRWRERDRWHRWGIGGEYLKSPAQISGEWVDEASAPSLVTPRGRHLNRAAIQKEAKSAAPSEAGARSPRPRRLLRSSADLAAVGVVIIIIIPSSSLFPSSSYLNHHKKYEHHPT